MKKTVFLKYSSVILAAAVLFSCTTLSNIFKEPKVTFGDVRVNKLDFSEITLDFSFFVDNPNSVSLEMEGFEYDLEIEGGSFIKGKNEKPLKIEARDKSIVTLPLTVNYKDMYEVYTNTKGKDQIGYKIKTVFTFDLPVFGKSSYPVEFEGSFPAVKAPEIAIESLKLKSLNPFNSELELILLVKNRNTFSVSIDSLDYDFMVNNVSWGKGISRGVVDFKEMGENRVILPLSVNPASVGLELINAAVNGRKLDMSFKSKASFRTGYPGFDRAEVIFDTADRKGIDK